MDLLFLHGCTRRGYGWKVAVAALILGSSLAGQDYRLPDVTYMDQPTGIELKRYLSAWPRLSGYIDRLNIHQTAGVEVELKERSQSASTTDGELNLLAQIAWRRGDLDTADAAIAKALSMRPAEPLHAFQSAMVAFAHLRRASGMLEQWRWQQRTRDAYQRTLDLDARNASARYYLAYSYLNTPWAGGGDKKKGLEMSQEGLSRGEIGFYVVRADAHRLRGEHDLAIQDYDKAIELKVFKLSAFVEAAQEELKRKDWQRARRYAEWAVHCRPDASRAFETLGDCHRAVNELVQAREAYTISLARDPTNASARKKLGTF